MDIIYYGKNQEKLFTQLTKKYAIVYALCMLLKYSARIIGNMHLIREIHRNKTKIDRIQGADTAALEEKV